MGKWQIASILELANSIAKQRAMWNSRPQVEHIWGIFDLVVFTVNFHSFDALARKYVFNNSASSTYVFKQFL